MKQVPVVVFITVLLCGEVISDTTVTIYNEWLSQGGRVHYEVDRWNKFNGLAYTNLISKCKGIGAEPGRWMNRDLNGNLFGNDSTDLPLHVCATSSTSGADWPNWIDKSHHQGKFPNNVDAAAEFVSLMVQGAKDYSGGHLPAYFEVINEPDASWQALDSNTVLNFHRDVAQKLKSRFGIKVGGPTYTGYTVRTDANNFRLWKGTTQFMDMSLDHMDFFSFHAQVVEFTS